MSNKQKLLAVLLPGIDGTGKMFGPLIEHFPEWLDHLVIGYPATENLTYQELAKNVFSQIPTDRPIVIIAESFAGPLSLMISELADENLKAIVLCATFLTNPRPWLSKLAPMVLHEWLLALPPRKWLARMFITGNDAPDDMLEHIFEIHKQVFPSVLINRLHEVFNVDVRPAFRTCHVPMLYLFGKRDHLVLKHSRKEIQLVRPDIEICSVDGPHFLLQTKPGSCMTEIVRFIQSSGINDCQGLVFDADPGNHCSRI